MNGKNDQEAFELWNSFSTPEGTPKLEEAAAKVLYAAGFRYEGPVIYVQEFGVSAESAQIETMACILRPFITPACTPEKWPDYLPATGMGAVAAIMNLWIREFISSPTAEQIRDAAKIIDSLLATPASTGEANGWVSVAIKPKGKDDDYGVLAAAPGWTVWAEYVPETGAWRNAITKGEILPEAWMEIPMYILPPAPTSVPQAEPPK